MFDLQKTKQSEASLKTDNKNLVQKIESCNKFVKSLKSQKQTSDSLLIAAEAQRSAWIEKKKNMIASIQSLQQKNILTSEKLKSKENEITDLQNELKSLQARVQQNEIAVNQNTRYFCQKIDTDGDNDKGDIYEIDELIDHRIRNEREFLVRWKGFGSEEDSWERECNILCSKTLNEYLKKHKVK